MADFKIDPPDHPPLGGEGPFGLYGFKMRQEYPWKEAKQFSNFGSTR